ncbi:MAG: cytoplasmic protein [Chloroflexi bacterium]|nr:cytoplasmic protein [Chloroflexota bacterium]
MSDKVAIVLMAGPEMPCRLMHTLIWALDIVQRGGEAKIVLEGESPRWLLELPDPANGRHKLYRRVKEAGLIDGVCKGCAAVSGALDAAVAEGLPLLSDASGHASLVPYLAAGFNVVTL